MPAAMVRTELVVRELLAAPVGTVPMVAVLGVPRCLLALLQTAIPEMCPGVVEEDQGHRATSRESVGMVPPEKS